MKKCRNAENERKHRFRENNPAAEAKQKAKERQKESLLRFHIKRNHLYGYGFPPAIDQNSKVFARVKKEYESTLSQSVEVYQS